MTETTQRSIALIGLSGTGKSTVARMLATRLGWFWIDIDAQIVQRASQSIAEIFGDAGEAYFRKLETEVLHESLLPPPASPRVIATGGGIVLQEENRTLLHAHSYTVWLDAPDHVLLERLQAHRETRPLLSVDDPSARLKALRAERHQLYHELADLVINTEGLESLQVAEQVIIDYMQRFTPPGSPLWKYVFPPEEEDKP
jgi:shikimate kinase